MNLDNIEIISFINQIKDRVVLSKIPTIFTSSLVSAILNDINNTPVNDGNIMSYNTVLTLDFLGMSYQYDSIMDLIESKLLILKEFINKNQSGCSILYLDWDYNHGSEENEIKN